MLSLISFLSFSLGILMLSLVTSYWMVGVLILQTLMVSLILALIKDSLWFSYILFLVFLGGLLVLFSYISGLTSEELLEGWSLSGISFMLTAMSFISLIMIGLQSELFTMSNLLQGFKVIDVTLWSLVSSFSGLMYSFIVSYLLLALICVANLMKSKAGPLRRFEM